MFSNFLVHSLWFCFSFLYIAANIVNLEFLILLYLFSYLTVKSFKMFLVSFFMESIKYHIGDFILEYLKNINGS